MMDAMLIDIALREWAIKNPLIGRLWVFGSRCRGDHKYDSDLDIAIELDLSAKDGVDMSGGFATWMLEKSKLIDELVSLFSLKIDLQQYRGSNTPTIQKALDHSSRLIYTKAGFVSCFTSWVGAAKTHL